MPPDVIEPPRIIVTFDPGNATDARIDVNPGVSIGQLALAGWLLTEQANDARRGQLLAAAQEQASIRALAAGLRNGGNR